jgi:hypothetical protein
MNTGIKKITHTSGKQYPGPVNASYIILEPDVKHHFKIAEWFDETPDRQNEKVIWRLRGARKNMVLKTCSKQGKDSLIFEIKKKLCGVTRFYLEAGPADHANSMLTAGLYINGYAKPLITKIFWTKTKGGGEFKETLKYGEIIFLHAETEGLNGNVFVVEVYFSEGSSGADFMIASYPNVLCKNGEFDLGIYDTFSWYTQMGDPPEMANFLVKIRIEDNVDGYYHDASKSALHAKFLRIEKKINKEKKEEDTNSPIVTG